MQSNLFIFRSSLRLKHRMFKILTLKVDRRDPSLVIDLNPNLFPQSPAAAAIEGDLQQPAAVITVR